MNEDAKPAKISTFNKATQVLLPTLTIGGFALTSLERPQWGLIVNLIAQIFWIYAGWQAWKKADQLGIFINSVVITIIVAFGVLNYWFI